jgi:hypothetical protein
MAQYWDIPHLCSLKSIIMKHNVPLDFSERIRPFSTTSNPSPASVQSPPETENGNLPLVSRDAPSPCTVSVAAPNLFKHIAPVRHGEGVASRGAKRREDPNGDHRKRSNAESSRFLEIAASEELETAGISLKSGRIYEIINQRDSHRISGSNSLLFRTNNGCCWWVIGRSR